MAYDSDYAPARVINPMLALSIISTVKVPLEDGTTRPLNIGEFKTLLDPVVAAQVAEILRDAYRRKTGGCDGHLAASA